MDGRISEKSSFPAHSKKFRVGIGGRVAVETNAGLWIEEGLPQGFNRNIRHFYVAGRPWLLEIFGTVYVRGVDDGNGPRPFILGFLVFHDWPERFGGLVSRPRKGAGEKLG